MSPEQRIKLHTWLVGLWIVLTIGTTTFAVCFPDSPYLLPWLIFISCYAIVSTHWAAREGAAPSAKEEGS